MQDWKQPDEYRDEETIAYTKRNIDYINRNAKVMTAKEVNEFIYRDYGKIINKGEE